VKPKRKKATDRRWQLGALVAVAIMVILGLKMLRDRSASLASGEPIPILAVASGLAVQGPMPAVTQVAAVQHAALASAPEPVPSAVAPLPKDPAGQIDWAIANGKPMMVLFHSTNCIPCKTMDRLVSQIRSEYEPEIVFVDVVTNDRANLTLIRQAGVQAIPTSFFVTPSGQGKRYVGAMKESALRAELASLLEGD